GPKPPVRSGPCGQPPQTSRLMTIDSAPQIWDAALGMIREHVSTPIYQTWFRGIRPGSLEPSGLVLLVPSRFAKEWLEPRYLSLISQAVASVAATDIPIELRIDPSPPTAPGSAHEGALPPAPPSVLPPAPDARRRVDPTPHHPRHTFD